MKINIAHKMIGEKSPIFIIAEAANSHEGSLDVAKKLVDAAVVANADAVKFQKFVTEELLVKAHPLFDLFKRLELLEDEWRELFDYAAQKKIAIFADVFDIASAEFFAALKMCAYKIHSTDLSNPQLLSFVAKQQKPIFLGVGASTMKEIEKALTFLHTDVVLMHGFQAFPTKIEDTNFALMQLLKEKFNKPIGFMDHVDGNDFMAQALPLAALGFGCSVIEKHVTLDRSQKGIDHESALNPEELKLFVERVRLAESAIGVGEKDFSKDEENYRLKMKKSIVASRNIEKGEKISAEMLAFKRASHGVSPMEMHQFIGTVATKNINEDEILLP